jgi:hypothetical protein
VARIDFLGCGNSLLLGSGNFIVPGIGNSLALGLAKIYLLHCPFADDNPLEFSGE